MFSVMSVFGNVLIHVFYLKLNRKFDAVNRRKTQIVAKSLYQFRPSGRNRKGKTHKRSSALSDDKFRIDRSSLSDLVAQTDLLHFHKE